VSSVDGSLQPSVWRMPACFAVAIALVVLDLWSKTTVFAFLETADLQVTGHGYHRYPLAGEWLALMENLNYGAAFGQGSSFPWLLVPLRAVALIVVSVLIIRAPRGQCAYLSALVLILSGAAGNLYDNLFNGELFVEGHPPFGPVRDFIDVYFGVWDWHFPTFNVADSCITVGAVLLVLSGMGEKKQEDVPRESDDEETAPA
jgi:signal peptidase II